MAKKSVSTKRLNAANLASLGAPALADLLIEMGEQDAAWKRRLRMELAAAVGPEPLADEIDKRIAALAAGRARVSWRKRPDLIRELRGLKTMIVERLAGLDAASALDRLVDWFDLQPGLAGRVKDPKGEVADLFVESAPDLAIVANLTPLTAPERLAAATLRRPLAWVRWLEPAAPNLAPALTRDLLNRLAPTEEGVTPGLRPVIRLLAEASDDVDALIRVLPLAERKQPDMASALADRLIAAGRLSEARLTLESADWDASPSRWSLRRAAPKTVPEAFILSEIALLEAEGRSAEAQDARWRLFEAALSQTALRDFVTRLPDFEDVEALDRAFAFVAAGPNARDALTFLMSWPALREAARLIENRQSELPRSLPEADAWAGRLEHRYPAAAAILHDRRA
ncbi:DUF6880 family protein [Brevundimonas lenta]|uniref:Uncharacterized protein n=1 Tax=Brevundimonas lenta TaxID=424796 RepID=A0A7W6JDM6_9CAUL|nr:DUF6880 family protein [Brevundimonas lenta]MBB4083166.1 hypothetical protein [Brevundimonas lenta]